MILEVVPPKMIVLRERRRQMMLVNPIELIVLVMMAEIQKIRAAVIRLPHYLVILMMVSHRHQT
jgi:hypothetical protein